MPKITEAHRALRRAQILDAAWRCFQREGVQATRMEHIIAESGLAASALYRYFRNKDDVILAAIETSMVGLSALLKPLVEDQDEGGVPAFLERAAASITAYSRRSGFDLMSIGIHGWSEAQRSPTVKALLARFYVAFRGRLAAKALRWREAGLLSPAAQPEDVSQMLMSLLLGTVAQAKLVDATDARAVARGVSACAVAGPDQQLRQGLDSTSARQRSHPAKQPISP
ncbi:MAG: TetR/AcrR family transcriptional regulator [Proteobacteria bacterium]|nr:TetR/AcrR family transcriptional regulator [Pseudomonadota bacterium]